MQIVSNSQSPGYKFSLVSMKLRIEDIGSKIFVTCTGGTMLHIIFTGSLDSLKIIDGPVVHSFTK